MTLPVSDLVNVAVTLSPSAAAGRNFGDLLIMGDSNVISGLERIRAYSSLTAVADDFGTTAPEYLAAQVYFGQNPQPTMLNIGRWLRAATAGELQGAILTTTQQMLSNFTSITSGGFDITIDGGSPTDITGLNFSTAVNLNNVASIIQAALSGVATCIWNGSQFEITSATTGAGVYASGTLTVATNPSAADTITVNGLSIEFVASSPTGNQVLIGASNLLTAVNLNTFLTNSVSPDLTVLTFSVSSNVVTVKSSTVGTAGNAYTLVSATAAVTVSAATLLGGLNASSVSYVTPGTGQDVSTLLGLTAALALPLVPGYNAETPLAAVQVLDNLSTAWYGLTFAASVQPTDDDNIAVAGFIEADEVTRLFGVTIQNTNVLSSEVTNDLASEVMALAYEQTMTQYSSKNAYAICSVFGRMFTVDFTASNTTINLMYKQEPGVIAEVLSQSQANTLQAKRCNVFVAYNNNTNILQYGTMAGAAYIDETFGIDWIQNAIQTAVYNVLYTSTTKVPQTDQGINQFSSAIAGVCGQGVTNGFLAPGTWNAGGFGNLVTGQFLKTGYYIYANPIALQSQSDRDARKSPPIQVAIKFAGAVNTVNILVSANP